jgi:hypothetical protein
MNFIPVKVSILYNMYNGDRAIGEASLEPTHRLGYLWGDVENPFLFQLLSIIWISDWFKLC